MIKRKIRVYSGLSFLLLLVIPILTSCDYKFDNSRMISPTSGLIQTISPATLTAISAEAELNKTQLPEPMGIAWSELDGLELEFWYVWDLDEYGSGMDTIVEKFNRDNDWGITVTAVDQGIFQNPRESVELAFQEGLVPNLMMVDDLPIPAWYREGYIVDLNPFIEDPTVGYTPSEINGFYPGVFMEHTLKGGIRPGIPFAQTIQVMYYNQSWAEELGFQTRPENYTDIYEQSCAASEATRDPLDDPDHNPGGLILYPDAANILSWIYAYQGSPLDQDNENYQFTSREVREVGMDWVTLRQDGCGFIVSGYPDPMAQEIEIERFNQRGALLIMGSSQNYYQIHTAANQTGRADDWIMIPFVGPEGDKAVSADVQSVVVFDTTPEEELAAWLFLKYLTHPETQAEWVKYSKFYPVHKDALPLLRDFRIENPLWSQGLSLLRYSQATQYHASWEVVRQALGDAFEEILLNKPQKLTSLLKKLDQIADELVLYSNEN